MSETWSSTRKSAGRLKAALRDADEDTRYNFAFWLTGLVVMATAIVAEFGWAGGAFCLGFLLWAVSEAPSSDD